jgi:hypothetical protein
VSPDWLAPVLRRLRIHALAAFLFEVSMPGQTFDAANVQIVDTNADGNTYFGNASPGTLTSAGSWQIQRMSTSGTAQTFKYADGDVSYDNVWDNRTSLTYP